MEVLYKTCCGIDVHKKMVVACLNRSGKLELRQFATTTNELRSLTQWLLENDCEMIAMESTSAYWKPLFNLFELHGISAMVVNAAHMKALPGRKTDVKDSEWIADLLRHGLLRASYIPNREQREFREIVRYRKSLIEERSRELNRLQKFLEGANIKLDSFVRNINGKSSRRLLEVITSNVLPSESEVLQLLHGKMHKKIHDIMQAIDGIISPVQCNLIKFILNHIDDMTARIEELDAFVLGLMEKYEAAIALIDEIPGIARRSAEIIIAEVGIDMSRFPSAAHLCSWAGVCPGNNESAGKRASGRITKGNNSLKKTLIQCAKAAAQAPNTFFSAQYQRISVRRGKNRATVAVAHSILISVYHVLKDGCQFVDLGSDFYAKFNKEKKIASYLKKLQQLGWEATATAS